MLTDELKQLLRELVEQTGAVAVSIVHDDDSRDGDGAIAVPIGGGAQLMARFSPAPADDDEDAARIGDRDAAMERAARSLRACARRWDVPTLPPLTFPDADSRCKERVRARIESYLQALSNTHGMVNATITHRGCPVASASPLTELQRERLPFTLKRVGAEAARSSGSSHADIAGDDFFAQSFWFDACLIAFFDRPYSVDFVRHRSRMVTREVSNLLPLLDDPDHDPAQVAPIPE